jgi:hypothetical protein
MLAMWMAWSALACFVILRRGKDARWNREAAHEFAKLCRRVDRVERRIEIIGQAVDSAQPTARALWMGK